MRPCRCHHRRCRWRTWRSRARWSRMHHPCRPPRCQRHLLFASHKQSAGTVCVRAQLHIRFLFIALRFRLGLAYRTPPRDDALALWLAFGSTSLAPGLSPGWIRAMHGTHVPANGHYGLAYTSALITSMPTNGWLPSTQASCPGGIVYDSPAAIVFSVPSFMRTVIFPETA